MVLDNDYEVLGRLGEGSFGKVYKAQHKRTGDEVAVKQIKLGSRSWEEATRSTELQALTALRHPFIVRLRELIRSSFDGSLYYIFEFIDSDLGRLVKLHVNGMEEMPAAELARQLFAGVAHMHHHGFFHRDLKPENVLYDTPTNSIRIADLGQARSLRARPPFTDYVGTRWYRAPECLLRDGCYSSPVDVWASGLIFAELVRGSPIFPGSSSIDQLYKIFSVLGQPGNDWPDFARLAAAARLRMRSDEPCGLPHVLPKSSARAHAFFAEVLAVSPLRRLAARFCVEHSFFIQLPPLEIDRLDTHRSSTSRRGPREPPEEIPDAPDSPASADDRTKASDEPSADMVDLDAELDRILGPGDGSDDGGDGEGRPRDGIGHTATAASLGTLMAEANKATPIEAAPGAGTPAAKPSEDPREHVPRREPEPVPGHEAEEQEWFLLRGLGAWACGDLRRHPLRSRAWPAEEASELRRIVRRVARSRHTRSREGLWHEVCQELGTGRHPGECKLQYARGRRTHKAGWIDVCRIDLIDDPPFTLVACGQLHRALRDVAPQAIAARASAVQEPRHYELGWRAATGPMFCQQELVA